MTEPVWVDAEVKRHVEHELWMPAYPYVRRMYFGNVRKKGRIYYASHGNKALKTFHNLEEAKAWLLTIARLEGT